MYATNCWRFLKGIQLLSTLLNCVFHLVHSTHLSLPSIKEFLNRLCFSLTQFRSIHLEQRNFYTDGKFPASFFRLLTEKNTDIFLKYYTNQSCNSKPEIITFSGQHSAIHSPFPLVCQLPAAQASVFLFLILISFVSCGLVYSHFSPHLSPSSFLQGLPRASSPGFLLSAHPPPKGPNSH